MSTLFIIVILTLLSPTLTTTTTPLSNLTNLNQLLIASLRNLDGQTRGYQVSDFSGPVIEAISMTIPPIPADTGMENVTPPEGLSHISTTTGRHRITINDIALTLNTYNFLLIASKVEYLVKTRQNLATLLFSFGQSQSTANRFFEKFGKQEPELRAVLDVRTLKNLNMLIGEMDTRIIPIAQVIQLANVFNQNFMKFLEKEYTYVYDLVNSFLPEIEKALIEMAQLIESTKQESEGKTECEDGAQRYDFKFGSYAHVIQVVNPVIYQFGEGKAFLFQLPAGPYSPIKIPSEKLKQASALYDLLNIFSEVDDCNIRHHNHNHHHPQKEKEKDDVIDK